MERETIEIVTPVASHKVVIKKWLTGRERREIRAVLFSGISIAVNPDETDEETREKAKDNYQFNGELLNKMNDKKIEAVVESVDGSNENVLDKVLDMHEEDYAFVVAEVDKASGDLPTEEKKS